MSLRNIASKIATEGLGVEGSSLFIGTFPAEVSQGVLLRQFGGDVDGELTGIRHLKFQAAIRAQTYPAAETLSDQVFQALNLRNLTILSAYFYHVLPEHEPAFMGADQGGLYHFVINFDAIWR